MPTQRNRSDEIPIDPNQRPIDAQRLSGKLSQQQAQQGGRNQMGGNADRPSEDDLGRDASGRRIPYPTD